MLRLLTTSVVFVGCTDADTSPNTYTGPGPAYVDTSQDTEPDTDTDADTDTDTDTDTDSDTDADTDTDTDVDTGSDPPAPPAADFTTAWGCGMMEVPHGTFSMGSGSGDPMGTYTDHDVTLTRDFWVGQTEVTQAQWALFSEAYDPAPSHHADCPSCPVDQVSWRDAALYANALSEVEGFATCYLEDGSDTDPVYTADPYACPGYRLLTEAEWEYAARGGVDTEYAGSNVATDVAWYIENAGGYSHASCWLGGNSYGLFDMSGNVREWVNDRASADYGGYGDGAPSTDPPGPTDPYNRMTRGGAWTCDDVEVAIAYRTSLYYTSRDKSAGFRLARTVSP